MNIDFSISVATFSPAHELAGAISGASWYAAVRKEIEIAPAGMVVLDFAGIRLATISWLREGLFALRKFAAALRPDIVLLVANLHPLVREELEAALDAIGGVIVAVDEFDNCRILRSTLLGRLDTALSETLLAIQGLKEFDASFISRTLTSVGQSAANNRLVALEAKGILKSERRGRTRVYRLVLEDMRYGRGIDSQSNGQLRTQATELP